MNTRRRSFPFSVGFLLLCGPVTLYLAPTARMQKDSAKASMQTQGGLNVVTFDTVNGQVIVNLPDDMRAGDTISGTVIEEPKGQTKEERDKNLAELKKYQVGIVFIDPQPQPKTPPSLLLDLSKVPPSSGNATQPAKTVPFTAPQKFGIGVFMMPNENAPMGTSGRSSGIVCINESCSPISQLIFTLPPTHPSGAIITHGDSPTTPTFNIPLLGQAGRSIPIFGPFDGNSSNTTLRVGRQDFPILAESPRQTVFTAPTNVVGATQIQVKEGNKETTSPFRSLKVDLTAPKTSLLKGESTELHVQVTGLEGIEKPVPLTLEAKGVITMVGGSFQSLTIQPSQVGAGGSYSTTRGITGVQTGGWEATATVVTQPFNIVLRDPTPPQTILVNSFTGDYAFCGLGTKLSGTGKIKRKGCVITLTDNKPDRQVEGKFDSCVPADNGRWYIYSGGTTDIQVVVTDTNPKKTKVYFKPSSTPRPPPVQDSSAFATCP